MIESIDYREEMRDKMRQKVRDNRLRRMAERQGLVLIKCRARDPRSLTYGRYALLDADTRFSVSVEDPLGRGYPFYDADDVEQWLSGE